MSAQLHENIASKPKQTKIDSCFTKSVHLILNLDKIFSLEPSPHALIIKLQKTKADGQLLEQQQVYITHPEALVNLITKAYKCYGSIWFYSMQNWAAGYTTKSLAEALSQHGLPDELCNRLKRAKLSAPANDARPNSGLDESVVRAMQPTTRILKRREVGKPYTKQEAFVMLNAAHECPLGDELISLEYKEQKVKFFFQKMDSGAPLGGNSHNGLLDLMHQAACSMQAETASRFFKKHDNRTEPSNMKPQTPTV